MNALEIAVKALTRIEKEGDWHTHVVAHDALASIAVQQAEQSTQEEIMKEVMKYGTLVVKDGKLIPLDQVFKSTQDIGCEPTAPPCVYCGSKTSVCDQSIAHPAKQGKGEV